MPSTNFPDGIAIGSSAGTGNVDGGQSAAVTAASEAHALNATFSDTEVEGALDTLGTKLNAVIVALEKVGILAE